MNVCCHWNPNAGLIMNVSCHWNPMQASSWMYPVTESPMQVSSWMYPVIETPMHAASLRYILSLKPVCTPHHECILYLDTVWILDSGRKYSCPQLRVWCNHYHNCSNWLCYRQDNHNYSHDVFDRFVLSYDWLIIVLYVFLGPSYVSELLTKSLEIIMIMGRKRHLHESLPL